MFKTWIEAVAVYRDRRMLCILFLGFASGLPLALTLGTLAAWMATLGVDKTTIGLFALVGLPYAFKFLWSPFIDGIELPFFGRALGRRRSWAILAQVALIAAIVALAAVDPRTEPTGLWPGGNRQRPRGKPRTRQRPVPAPTPTPHQPASRTSVIGGIRARRR